MNSADRNFVDATRAVIDQSIFQNGCFGGGTWSHDFDPPTVGRLLKIIDELVAETQPKMFDFNPDNCPHNYVISKCVDCGYEAG